MIRVCVTYPLHNYDDLTHINKLQLTVNPFLCASTHTHWCTPSTQSLLCAIEDVTSTTLFAPVQCYVCNAYQMPACAAPAGIVPK